MKLSGMKIGTRLVLSFIFILLGIAVLGAIAVRQSAQIAQWTTDLYEHPLTVRRALGELKADILSMHLEMKNLSFAKDGAGFESTLQTIAISETNAARQFEILYDRYLGERADVDIAMTDFTRWNAIRQETIRLLREGKTQEAIARTLSDGAGGKLVTALMGHIKKIDDFAYAKGDQFFRDSAALKQTLDRQLGYTIAGIFALSFFIAFALIRSVRRPLAELTAAARQFRDGRRDARSAYRSHDEFGDLSDSFNELAESVETEFTLHARVSALAEVMLGEDDARLFCRKLLGALIEHTGAQLGAVYLLNDDKTRFEPFESIGMDADRFADFSAAKFEGEFGPALASGKIQRIAAIAEDSLFTLKAASGEILPKEIMTVPLRIGDETMAIISLASVSRFGKDTSRLLDTVLSTMSARMDGILAYKRLAAFSRKLEDQNRELKAQKGELLAQARELTEQNVELERQKRQLDQANKLKTSFLSTMSHELRTPLNSVIALSGVLGRRLAGKLPDEEYGYLDVIERNGKQLLTLINDILDLSRIESGREELEIDIFNPEALIREVVDLLAPQAIQKNIGLAFHDDGGLPELRGDYEKCRHILQNVVANAVKFTEKGGVEISAVATAQSVLITVRDTGIGIDEKYLPIIFDEFRQADDSTSRKYGGTGLGLAIAKKYAELLGGGIEVDSEIGKGSRFTIRLPLDSAAGVPGMENGDSVAVDGRNLRAPRSARHDTSPALKDGTILLVEDSEAVVVQMRDMLTVQGYSIIVARNGGEALDAIARTVPDAMILDLMMPEVDGFEVLKRIRDNKLTERLPVIILTAKYVTKEELAFLRHNHIQQLIQKGDINKRQLLDAVARMMAPFPSSALPLVLTVEDDPDNLLTLRALLEGVCRMVEVKDGREALSQARGIMPDLILLDIAMPGVGGIETLSELRQDESLRGIPVIAVSASAMKGDRESFLAFGFNAYVSKPIDRDALISAMAACIKENPKPRQALGRIEGEPNGLDTGN